MVWNQCKENISTENRVNYINHVIKEDQKKKKFRFMDLIFHNEIEPFIIQLSKNDDVNDSWDEMHKISWY